MSGLVLHWPCASGILHFPTPKSQYCFASGQAVPAIPPQTAPAPDPPESMGLHWSVSSTFRKVPGFGLMARNCLTKALNSFGVELKPASAHAFNPPSIGTGPPFLGLYTAKVSTVSAIIA